MRSIWEETAKTESRRGFAPLDRDAATDVLVIGGGLCGLLCAWTLHRAGIDCILAEAEMLMDGTTKNTTAKITVQHGLIYDHLIRTFGVEKARQYLHANEAALRQYAALCREIDCDFEEKDAYVYALDGREKIDREIAALTRLGAQASFCDTLPLPFPVAGAVRMAGQAQFHPLKFAGAIAKGLDVHEHTRVRELIGTTAVTDGGVIRAKRIIAATHFPFLNRHGSYFLKLYQHRSYVIALKNAAPVGGMYVDVAPKGLSLRDHVELLLLGGGAHRTGKPGGNWQELRDFARCRFPRAEEVAHWAAQDCMSLDDVPYIGPYSARTEGLYVATGFNKWGMTSSMAAAMILTDMLLGKENPDSAVFSPSRSILRPQLAVNGWEAAVNLFSPAKRRCPHLGCALKWNPQEHTWDCPCHGSRFTQEGQLIDGPATGDLPRDDRE